MFDSKPRKLKVGEHVRQGDLLFEYLGDEELNTNELEEIQRKNGWVVVAHGETGHAHKFVDEGVFLYENKQEKEKSKPHLYLAVDNDKAVLSHEEHPQIPFVTKGKYRVINQKQYIMREVRTVLD
jgi:hypothetical protein